MLKAWKLKSKFKKPDDLIFPNGEGNHIGHDNLIKRQFNPLFETLEATTRMTRRRARSRRAASIGMGFDTLLCHVGLKPV